jgi:hypothetical protein
MTGMRTQLIVLDGHIRALCSPHRALLVDDTAPDTRFVLAMCLYAGAVLNHRLPGPYRESDAKAFAAATLIAPQVVGSPARVCHERTHHRPQRPGRRR